VQWVLPSRPVQAIADTTLAPPVDAVLARRAAAALPVRGTLPTGDAGGAPSTGRSASPDAPSEFDPSLLDAVLANPLDDLRL